MRASEVRKFVSKKAIRESWQENTKKAHLAGFSREVIFFIEDDADDLLVCWCCGRPGYQEIAHIIPHSLGGKCEPQNLFLMCQECHAASPDLMDHRYFVRFVNDRAGSYVKSMAKTINSALSKMVDLCRADPEAAERFFAGMKANSYSKSLGDKMKTAESHGASQSTSTVMAVAEMATDLHFAKCRADDDKAMLSHAPWRVLSDQSSQMPLI